jgi:Zn-dependent protease with chaperone function
MPKLPRMWALSLFLLPIFAFVYAGRLAAQSTPSSSPLASQSSSPQSDDDPDDDYGDDPESGPRSIFLATISFDGNDHLTVQASALQPDLSKFGVSDLKAALQSAVGCSLTDTSNLKVAEAYYLGSCTLPRSGSPLLREGKISTAPLRRYCQQYNLETLTVTLEFADSEFLETVPPAPTTAQVNSFDFGKKEKESFAKYSQSHPVYRWDRSQSIPATIDYRFGYQLPKLRRGAMALLLILLAPIALVAWLGRKALSADVADKSVVWFSYMRTLSWVLNGSLLIWWAALDFFQIQPLLRFLAAGSSYVSVLSHPAAAQILGWVPPSLIWLFCYRLSHPVQEKLRGLHWTKRELTLQAFYSVLAGLFPFALFLTGISLLSSDSSSVAIWFTAAIMVRVFAAKALLKVTGMQPHALTTGPLRDRAFEMAHRLGVNLQQVYLIPSGKGQMANAFASSAHHISFTDLLLERMSAREIDFVVGHELTHLKDKHPSKLAMVGLGGLFLGVFVGSLIGYIPAINFALTRYLVIFGCVTAFPYFMSRRFEYSADAGAVAITGDPRAAISALFKLAELNMTPTQWSRWSEKWLTHPSSVRRAQAIAKRAAITVEEIPVIAREGAADNGTYLSQTSATPANKLHSTTYKAASVQKLSWILLAILSFLPSFFALAALHLSPDHPALKLSLFAVAIPATFAAVILLFNYIPRLTRGNIAARLDQKLSAQAIQVESWGGVYVGYAPAAAPRIYEANSFWDVGYLFFRSDRICYWGEEVQFALRREQITAVKLDPGAAGFLGSKRIYIAWRDNAQGTCGVFNIGSGHADSILSGARQTSALADRLQIWWKTSSPARPVPQPLDTLSSPTIRNVTCAVPGALWKGGKLFNELFATAWIAALAAMLCGLPFHLTGYLFSPSHFGVPVANPYHSPGAGWFVVLAAPVVRLLSLIPTLRYRDKPILVAQSPENVGSAVPPPPPPVPTPSTAPPREPFTVA